MLVAAPLSALIMRRFVQAHHASAAKGAMAETSALSTAMMESLDGIKIVKIENREAFEEAPRRRRGPRGASTTWSSGAERPAPAPRRPPSS